MKNEDFFKWQKELTDKRVAVMVSKGKEYTKGNDDKLFNFKEQADQLNLDALQIWAVYFNKHIASIINYIKDRKVHSEPIEGRFIDAINYLELGLAIINEQTLDKIAVEELKKNYLEAHKEFAKENGLSR